MKDSFDSIKSMIKAVGLVFGDIGTSPIYTLTVIFMLLTVSSENVIGILSLVIWSLILVVTIQYGMLAMSLSKHGEGGAIVINEILRKFLRNSRSISFFSYLTYLGISLFIGDSVITPAISILSAVEGLKFIDTFQNISQSTILIVTLVIAVVLFCFQYKGTEKITSVFGPIMIVWFIVLFVSGLVSIMNCPSVLKAFNPNYAIQFLLHGGIKGFFILSEVILCMTGAEALYADMGHLGKKPIINAWFFVFIALVINYLGQGAFLLLNPESNNVLFEMINSQAKVLYIPFLLLSVMATIIASQAVISGFFAIVYQGINTEVLPLFKINYTSEKINSQIYIGSANWFLLFFTIVIVLVFKQSSNLASAYGLTVTCTFAINAFMMINIFFARRKYFRCFISVILMLIDLMFLIATLSKIKTGAYWSIIISVFPLLLMILYTRGQKAISKSVCVVKFDDFLEKFLSTYQKNSKVSGTALFFAQEAENIPQYIYRTMFDNGIIYTDNIIVKITKSNEARGIFYDLDEVTDGLSILKIYVGYMERLKIDNVLKTLNIDEKVIFYGITHIDTRKIIWRIFSMIKRLAPTFINFYKLPSDKVCGVISHIKF